MKKASNDGLYNGIIVINKPKGFTSHDVVGKVRRILNMRKVGHTGTLDPEATGVLPVCVGKGTKVSDMLMVSDKVYTAQVKLGVVTDTQDIYGNVIKTSDASHITELDIKDAIMHFTGEIEQIPPMYSAIKINGQKMYELARKGIEVERKSRKITIYGIELVDVSGDVFTISVSCSKGTYIRTLCNDIGEYLKCGACMQSLERTKSSIFDIESSVTLEELERLALNGCAESVIIPIDSIFKEYPEFTADDEIKKRLLNGAPSTVELREGFYRVYDKKDNFIAIGKVENINGRNKIKSEKLFCDNQKEK